MMEENPIQDNAGSVRHELLKRAWKLLVIVIMLTLTTVLNFFLKDYIQPSSLVFIYLVATIAGAVYFGTWAAVTAFIGGFLIYNFLFVEPYYSLHISDPQDLYNIGIYFAVAGLVTYLINTVREQNRFLRRRLDRASLVEAMSRDFLLLTPLREPVSEKDLPESFRPRFLGQLGQMALRYAGEVLDVPSLIFFTEKDGSLKLWAKSALDLEISQKDKVAADWTLDNGEVSGAGTFNNLDAAFYFMPIKSHEDVIGVMGVRCDANRLFPEQRRLLATIANLTSLVAGRWPEGENSSS